MRQDIAVRFARETANHRMTVLHDEGLYRHVRFKQPDTGFYWFDLVTWPGNLSVTGDFGDGHTFARIPDMFEFFRGSSRYGINAQYWAEKVITGRGGLRTYEEDRFRETVIENFVEIVRYGDAPRGLGKAVREQILDDPDIYYEAGARSALDAFEFNGFRFESWEWDFTEYDWSYLWCCHAIVWGIEQYDAARVAVAS